MFGFFGLLITLIFIPNVNGACKRGWIPNGNSCYYFSRFYVGWSAAEFDCETVLGGYLAEVETQAEETFLRNHLKKMYDNDPNKHNIKYWIGGSDMEVEGEYMWMKSKHEFDIADWYPGQPSNGGSTGHEDCVNMAGSFDFRWNDLHCSFQANFICEMPAVPSGDQTLG